VFFHTKLSFSFPLTAAIECLKRKKYYEGKMDQLGTFQLHIRNQVPTRKSYNKTAIQDKRGNSRLQAI
ncbi:hypothetical protein BHE74_00042904, partial [Ensete ventricosum]